MLTSLSYEFLLWTIVVLFGINIIYAIIKIRKRFLHLFFQIAIFTFLLSRPFIELCQGIGVEGMAGPILEGRKFVLVALIFVEIFLLAGAILCEKFGGKIIDKITLKNNESENDFGKNLQIVALCVCIVTLGLYLLQQLEPLLTIGTQNYLAYYTSFESKLPGIVHTIASFMKYSLCIYLATLPKKRSAFIMLAVYVLSTIPSLMVGMRNPFVLSLLFALSYYLLRDFLEKKNIWVGKVEKALMCIGIPVGMIAMIMYSFFRAGVDVTVTNPLSLIVDFFHQQGVTFDVAVTGYSYRAELINRCPVNYTFGGIIDYIYRGTVGQKLFGTLPLTAGNSEFNATHSNSLAHVLSYVADKDRYAIGGGLGSSFILETYIDFGYIGIIVFSLILGALLIFMVQGFGKRVLLTTIVLYALTNIFFAPRAEATGWLTFIVTIQFWACVAACYLGAYICTKFNIFERIFKKGKALE